jgi:hypothetical protein
MLDVLGPLVRTAAGSAEDVPELDPPVEQKRRLGGLAAGHVGLGEIFSVHAVHVASARTRLWLHVHDHVGIEHGLGKFAVVSAEEVVVDVRVELVAWIRLAIARQSLAIGHDGRAVERPCARVHVGHLGSHLGVLHRDGRGSERRGAGAEGARGRAAWWAGGVAIVDPRRWSWA